MLKSVMSINGGKRNVHGQARSSTSFKDHITRINNAHRALLDKRTKFEQQRSENFSQLGEALKTMFKNELDVLQSITTELAHHQSDASDAQSGSITESDA